MKYCKVSCVFWCSLLTMYTCILQGQGIGGVSISAGEGLSATTTAEGVYVLNNVTAGGYTIQVGSIQKTKKGSIIHVITVFNQTKTQNNSVFICGYFLSSNESLLQILDVANALKNRFK